MASSAESKVMMASLLSSLSEVPPTAIPPMLDCILVSTNLSPLSLFTCLLDSFSNLTVEHGKLDSDKNDHVVSLVYSVCHLLRKIGKDDSSLKLFISRCFIPLSRMVNENGLEILNQAAESLCDITTDTSSWEVVEKDLVPVFLRSISSSMGMLQNEGSDIYEWSRFSVSIGSDKHINDTGSEKQPLPFQNGSIPLSISCDILASVLNAALQHQQTTGTLESILPNGCHQVNNFAAKLLGVLCSLSLQMLSQSSKHRICAIHFLLPTIFNAFISFQYSEISSDKQKQEYLSCRKDFSIRIWKCCRTLFAVGPVERRDAYNALSLYLSCFPPNGAYKHVDLGNTKGEFDIGAEKEFWDQIKEGLVDKESFVRKQSLHILKRLVLTKEESPRHPNVPETFSHDKKSISKGMTKRGLWAEKEARSMGVGKINNLNDSLLTSKQRWEAFILLYETLEEYGTHLVEAAWNYQITLLIHSSSENVSSMSERARQNQMEIPGPGRFSDWLTVLWERGFNHDNPHVRCLIMQSFLEIEWTNHEDIVKYLPESFVLGPFIQGLNDPVHHKDFGVKGNYTSRIIEDAAKFLQKFTRYFNKREHLAFLNNLASIAKKQSFGRAGLMGLVECISSAACGVQVSKVSEVGWNVDAFPDGVLSFEETSLRTSRADFLDVLRFIIETSRQHFNHNYRLRVCERVLEAAASTMSTFDLPLGTLLLFISVLPTEFTDNRGSLRAKLLEWLSGCCRKSLRTNCCSNKMMLLNNLYDFSTKFISHDSSASGFLTYDDEDLEAWHLEAKRWARVLFLVIRAEHHLEPLLMFIQDHARNMCQQIEEVEQYSMRFIVLILSLVEELQMVHERFYFGRSSRNEVDPASREMLALSDSAEAYNVLENFSNCLGIILVELVSYAHLSCLVFWDYTIIKDMSLPSSIKGKLGGPSQRRLSSSATSTVLKAIMSMKTLSIVLSFCTQFDHWYSLDSAFTFLWKFFWNVVSSSSCSSGVGAEIGLAACEALVPVLKALASTFFPFAVSILRKNQLWPAESERCVPLLDSLVVTSIQHINSLLTVGELARSRRAVLIDWKWLCLESLLSVPLYALENGLRDAFLSDSTKRLVFCDLVESLENAGEGSVLPMLRSLRLLFGLFSSGRLDSCRDHIDAQMMWSLVRSSWIMHVSCKKRRIAPISALLSSVLHPLIFGDESFHSMYNEPGPLKWFIGKILEEGTKSPRTIHLAALHLTGLWLVYPRIIQYYIKELILISLHGSVAFDEDFEAELAENNDAKSEVSLLAKSVDPGLTEAFINTELYARISVSVLFSKLADMADSVGSGNESKDCLAALESGKLFLLELLDFVVNNVDLRKELYKKYSAIHRRKARAWQMLCVLSRFVRNDIVQQVTHDLHLCLYRNNLPSVRQYLESFAINLYLRFPSLVAEQLVPILQDHEMRPQALSSYVFIATNVILHAPKEVQSWHLNELFPPIIPLLTSHHHSLRGFTQLLVYQVLCKQSLVSDSHGPETPLEKRCFEDLKLYLSKNSDCARLRASMEGYLDEFDPKMSVSPAGIFTSRVEVQEFECVPRSLMEQVLEFLNDARDDLRCSMAKDAMTIKNESISGLSEISERSAGGDGQPDELHNDLAMDFQKKITLSKHESHTVFSSWRDTKVYKSFSEMEKEDLLLDQVLQLRSVAMERIRASQQPLILVASLIDRIPNLAGLARTCEVFKASSLAVADTSILHDKQFQLISVTAEKWVPIVEVPVSSMKLFLGKKKKEGFSILGLEQTANSIPLDQFNFPQKTVLVLGREKEGIPVDIIHILDACIEIPQLGVVRSLNVHVSGAIALWEYTRQRRLQ